MLYLSTYLLLLKTKLKLQKLLGFKALRNPKKINILFFVDNQSPIINGQKDRMFFNALKPMNKESPDS